MSKKQLELYIHIPFCVRKCQYCDFLSFPADDATQNTYVEALLREIIYYGPKCRDYIVTTVYIGGGTPSWLAEEAIEAVMAAVYRSFSLAADAEISIECNPGTVTERKFAAYRHAGINRISIGLQSANDTELALLGRIHTFRQFIETYELARRNGFDNINVDLMNSLPGQTLESFWRTLHQVLRLGPEHISAYSLIVEEGTPFFETYQEDVKRQEAGEQPRWLPTEDEVNAMTRMTEQILTEAGYHHYEISNFARPGYECRHNIGYWERVNYLGLGIGAASLIENVRYSNTRDICEYIKETKQIREEMKLHVSAETISRKAQIEEFMFLGMRKTDGISRDAFVQSFGVSVEAVYPKALQKLEEEGLVAKQEGRIFLTGRGQEISNYVLAQFLL